MSFNITDAKRQTNDVLTYNYPRTTLMNVASWQNIQPDPSAASTYYKIAYPTTSGSSPLLFYKKDGYTPTFIYFFKVLHTNIKGLTDVTSNNIVGEMVIEHESTSSSKKLYLCVFITNPGNAIPNSNQTFIDKFFTMINAEDDDASQTSMSFTMNTEIPSPQKFLTYQDPATKHTIIMLTSPIPISSATSTHFNLLTNNSYGLFSIDKPASPVTTTTTSDKDAIAKSLSNEDGQIYIQCNPTGPSIDEINTYNIPIGSALSKDIQNLDLMKTSVNFFLFCFGLILVYVGVPAIYKMGVIDKTIANYDGKDSDKTRKIRIRSIDIFLSFSASVFILLSFYYGFKGEGDYGLITQGLFAFVMFGISISLIMIKKLDEDWLKSYRGSIKYGKDDEKETSYTDMSEVGKVFSDIFAYFISSKGALLQIIAANTFAFAILVASYKGDIYNPDFVSNFINFNTYHAE